MLGLYVCIVGSVSGCEWSLIGMLPTGLLLQTVASNVGISCPRRDRHHFFRDIVALLTQIVDAGGEALYAVVGKCSMLGDRPGVAQVPEHLLFLAEVFYSRAHGNELVVMIRDHRCWQGAERPPDCPDGPGV